MRVDLVSFRSAGPAGTSASLLSEWRVGAILQAVAVRDALTGQLSLDIGNLRYAARMASADGAGPVNGERLQLRVLRNSPVLALETVPSPTPPESASDVVSDALRRYVPRQESPALMLANLAWVTQDKGTATALPRAVMQAAANLWEALADAETLSDPAALERAVTRSGVFLESSLASGNRATITAAAATDLKALMLSLRQVLREHGARPAASRTDASPHTPVPTARGPLTSLPATPATFALADAPADQMNELARQTDGALARLTTVQVANSSQDVPVQSMLVELPVRHENRASMLRLRIERDGSRAHEDTAESWTVEAAVDLGVIGALHARVTLTGQRIGVQLRAESAAVVDALSARAPELEAMLREAGLEVERVACLHGMPAGDAGRSPTRLLDVRA